MAEKKCMPGWAKKLEDWGLEMERKYGNSKTCCEGSDNEKTSSDRGKDDVCCKDVSPTWKRNNPGSEIVGNLISYLIVTYVPGYFPGFFLDGFSVVRTVIYASIIVHIAASVLMMLIPIRPIHYLGRTIMELAGLTSMLTMVVIFPFNFIGNVGPIVQFALWVAIVIVAIVTFFEFLNIFGHDTEK